MKKACFVAALAFIYMVGTTLTVTSCLSKPPFTGDDVPRACGAGLQMLPDDIIITASQFFSVDDLNRDGLDDLALMAEDSQGGQRVYVYFGAVERNIDINCWDHEIVATGFRKIGGVKIEQRWHGGSDKGTLFIFGQDNAETKDVRLEAHIVDRDQTFASPLVRSRAGEAPTWSDGGSHSAFFVWRSVGSGEELLFGGDAKVFNVETNVGGIGAILYFDASSTILQMMDLDESQLLVDTGLNVYLENRLSRGSKFAFSMPLQGGGGSTSGKVFAAQEWTYQGSASLGVRVSQFDSNPSNIPLQLLKRSEVTTKVLGDVSPVGGMRPIITGAAVSTNVGQRAATLAAIVSTFDDTGALRSHQLVIEKDAAESGAEIVPEQQIKLDNGLLPVVTAGAFSLDEDRNFLVIYPRRIMSEARTKSVCYHAVEGCLAECGATVCAAQ